MAVGSRRAWYWEDLVPEDGKAFRRPPGEDLAAMRLALNGKPGAVPALWRLHRARNRDELARIGLVSDAIVAEHYAFGLFGVHQQSRSQLMHAPGVELGTAVRRLHTSGAASKDGIDAVFTAAATATTPAGVFGRLRGLVDQLNSLKQPFDYTQLVMDLRFWDRPEQRTRIRVRWGNAYHAWSGVQNEETAV
ncbi:type I-E CRISPR-associated protein Cse2/CasB [Kitasatospora indigofera]|uniref:type I-E CRISPR-associated protein Cse2/CasB n=1 Tax=Kitasatospora indigofera TaxID=67307 RepID=UPI0036CEFDE6